MAIPESIKEKANKIRNEVYGRDVREALASGIEEAGDIADQANTKSNDAVEQVDNIQAQVNQLVIDGDSSVEAAQARVDEKGQTHSTLKDRIDDGFIKVNSQLAETAILIPPPTGTDDTDIIKQAISTGYNVTFSKTKEPYLISESIRVLHDGQKIIGNGMMNTIIEANADNIDGFIVEADGVLISDLQLKNFTYSGNDEGERHAIRVQGVDSCVIERVMTDNCDDAGIRVSHLFNKDSPSESIPATNCKVLYCITKNTINGSGIELLNSEGTIVDGCISINSAFHGIRIAGSRECKVINNTIIGFGLGDSGFGEGIYCRGGVNRTVGDSITWKTKNIDIINNNVFGNKTGIGFSNESENINCSLNRIVIENHVSGVGINFNNNNSISGFGSKNIRCYGNSVTGDYAYAVRFVEGGENINLTENVFEGFREAGIYIDTDIHICKNVNVLNNDFVTHHGDAYGFRNFRKPQNGITVNGNIFSIVSEHLAFRDAHGGCYRGSVSRIKATRSGNRMVVNSYARYPVEMGSRVRFETTGILPTPLQPNTDYYIIRDTDYSFRIAETFVSAINGQGIELKDDGQGIHTIITTPNDTNVVNVI